MLLKIHQWEKMCIESANQKKHEKIDLLLLAYQSIVEKAVLQDNQIHQHLKEWMKLVGCCIATTLLNVYEIFYHTKDDCMLRFVR